MFCNPNVIACTSPKSVPPDPPVELIVTEPEPPFVTDIFVPATI